MRARRRTIIENDRNAGFGGAINQGLRASTRPVSSRRSTTTPSRIRAGSKRWSPRWSARPDAGMCASQVRLFGEHRLDSAGMLVALDGSSKQRGQGRPPEDFPVLEEVLLPSGSAALYRRAMLDEIGGFDDDFFLYCEDTDLGLRARWAGWKCLYVPDAVVEHHYSHSAGGASPLKAYYVERNRLFVLAKNFPAAMLAAAPFVSARPLSVARALSARRAAAAPPASARRATRGPRMAWYVVRAHLALSRHAGRLRRQRREIRARARITPRVFQRLVRSHSISARRLAAL